MLLSVVDSPPVKAGRTTFDVTRSGRQGKGQEPVKLLAFLYDSYLLRRPLKASSSNALIWTVGKFAEWKSKQPDRIGAPDFSDLTEESLSRFVRDLEGVRQPGYVKRLRADLITIWKDAAREHPEQVKAPNTERIRAVRVPQRTPEAWTFAQVKQLLRVCSGITGEYPSGITKAAYWRAWILVAWDTGIRPSDVQLIRFAQVREGSITLTQVKTGRVHWAKLSPATLSAIDAIRQPERELILPWPHTPQAFQKAFAKLVEVAGLKGTPKKLRKSAASEVERQQPGSAQAFLGHNTPGLAYKNYVDPTIANPDRPAPRSLDDE